MSPVSEVVFSTLMGSAIQMTSDAAFCILVSFSTSLPIGEREGA